jgi:hypothetical protein
MMRSLFAKISWVAVVAAVGMLLFGCSDGDGGGQPLVVSDYAITITPDAVTTTAGAQVPLTAVVTLKSDGTVVADAVVTWSVSQGLGSITEAGLFTAATQAPQAGTITATALDATASIPVTVNAGALAAIAVIAPDGTNLAQVASGTAIAFSAAGADQYGNPVAISPVWSVEGGIGQVDQQGAFLAGTAGNGTVVATVDTVRGTKDLTVVAGAPVSLTLLVTGNGNLDALLIGQQVHFTAYNVDGAGNRGRKTRSVTQAAWSVTGGVGNIDQDGNFVATNLGTGAVVAEKDGRTASLAVTVTRAFVGAIAFTKQGVYGNLAVLTGDGTLSNLTTGNNHFGEAAWAPTAAQLAFVSQSGALNGICVANADGSGARVLYGVRGNDPAWSPDGGKVVFSSGVAGIAGELVVIAEGQAPKTLAVGAAGAPSNPAWSPDGRKIAFCVNSGFSPSDGVYIMNADGTGAITRIYSGHAKDIAWKPGTDSLAVADSTRVYLISATGGVPQLIASDGNPINAIAWSPAGNALVCSVPRGAFAQLVLKLIGTDTSLPLTNLSNASALDPTWK